MENTMPKQINNRPLKCLIVDDEPGAIEGIVNYINKLDFLEVAGACFSAIEAAETLRLKEIDLMYLDINMSDLSGLEFLESLKKAPLTIITTAYSEHALAGFRLNVVDFLLKPISFQRFFQAAQKTLEIFRSRISLQNSENESGSDIYIRQGDSFIRILRKDILYVESMQNYIKIHLEGKTHLIHRTMSSMENIFPEGTFFRIHKSFLVNVSHIESISGGRVCVKGKELPLSRHRREALFNMVVNKKLVNK
jgi:DNA-binding LytR/AlgR family response regulator